LDPTHGHRAEKQFSFLRAWYGRSWLRDPQIWSFVVRNAELIQVEKRGGSLDNNNLIRNRLGCSCFTNPKRERGPPSLRVSLNHEGSRRFGIRTAWHLAGLDQLEEPGQGVAVRVLAMLAGVRGAPQVVKRSRSVEGGLVPLTPVGGGLGLAAKGVAPCLL